MTVTDEDRRESEAAIEALKASGVTVKRGAEAKRPPLPRYDGPPPETIEAADALITEVGRKYSGFSEETAAAIIHLRGEADRPAGEEDQATGIPEAETSTDPPADRGPEGLEEEAGPVIEASPQPRPRKVRPVPEPTGEGAEVPLWGDVIMKVYPETRGTYPIEFAKGGDRICIEAPRTPPWLSSKLQDRLISGILAALPEEGRTREFVRQKITAAFTRLAERQETDTGVKLAMTPAPVRRMIEETESVIVYPGEATFYEVTIEGRTLTITAAQMARVDPGFINAAVLNAFPLDPLDAGRNDWLAIKNYWLSPDVAEVRDLEEASEAEATIDRLRANLAPITIVDKAEEMIGDHRAWYDEKGGRVWVLNTRITKFVEEELKKPPGYTSALSKMLRAAGEMPKPSTKIRGIGNFPGPVRCWGFLPTFAAFKHRTGAPLTLSAVLKKTGGRTE